MNTELKQSISTAEKNGWELDYYADHYAVVFRKKDTIWKRKLNVLKQIVKSRCETLSCDYFVVVILWDGSHGEEINKKLEENK